LSKALVPTLLLAALAASADAAYVMEQIGPPFTIQPFPRYLNTEYAAGQAVSSFAYDDFSVAVGGMTNFVDVDMEALGPFPSSAWPQAVSWRVNLWSDNFGQPGALLASVIVPGSSVISLVKPHKPAIWPYGSAIVRVPANFFLAPGTYWICCTPIEPVSATAAYFVGRSNWASGTPHNGNAWLIGATNIQTGLNWPYRVDL
jgi:hypothetical protein